MAIDPWSIKGELALNCSCEVFCPCVVSLGAHPPTNGYCQAWVGIRIDKGKSGKTKLDGLNVAMVLDIPGRMGEGNWAVGLYVDEAADDAQFDAIQQILSGQAKGTTGLFRLLVSTFLGARRAKVGYETNGAVRRITADKAILGEIRPIDGAKPEKLVTVENTSYWMGPKVIIAEGLKSKVRDFGRVWSFDGKSAEICPIAWAGP